MTTGRRDGGDTAGGDWIRKHPKLDSKLGYDLEDIDRLHTRLYYWHQYLHGELMIIEEKQYNKKPTDAQKDTFGIVNQALKKAFADPEFRVKRYFSGRTNKYTYFGYWLVQYEKTSPLDGGIRIHGIPVTVQEYERFLQFDRSFIQERLRFNPLTVPISEFLQKSNRRVRKADRLNVPTLFNPTPTQQQAFEWEVQHA